MKTIESSLVVKAPEGVTLTSKARVVTVKGPRGTLTRSFKHLNAEITIVKGNALKIGVWFGDRKHVACIRTVSTHINNMIKGVTKVFINSIDINYKLYVYHVGISIQITWCICSLSHQFQC